MIPFYEIRRQDFSITHNFKETDFKTHIHKDIEIVYMRSGTQHIIIDDTEYEIKQGEAALIFPEQPHEYYSQQNTENRVEQIIIICSPKFYRNFLPDMSSKISKSPILVQSQIPADVKYALNAVDWHNSDNVIFAWILLILSKILENIEIVEKKRLPYDDLSIAIIEYINENFYNPLTLESLAETFYVNKNTVSKIFSEKIKTNFRKYLGIIRAEHAANLIRTTNDNFTTIFEKSGFESQSTFNRVFYDIYKMTPREFRNNVNKYTQK